MTDSCTTSYKRSKIKVEEHGKQAVFLNDARKLVKKIRFDGCVVKGVEACDFVVLDPELGYVLVELKGRDVEKALQQIKSSVEIIKDGSIFAGKFGALIVCTGVRRTPKFTTAHQRLQSDFNKKYKAPIHIVNGSYEFKIENLISYGNPIRG